MEIDEKRSTAKSIASWFVWAAAAIILLIGYMVILGIGKEAGRLGKDVANPVPSTQNPSSPKVPSDMAKDDARAWNEFINSERGKNLDKFNEAGSAAEKAARFGLSLQEYQRRYARSDVLCVTTTGTDDYICRADVIAGMRQ